VIGLLGGTFNPPHNGHVALALAAKEQFGLERVIVLVAVRPGYKRVELEAATRLRLAQAAFPDDEVELDQQAFTVETLRAGRWEDPIFLVGADQFLEFPSWKDPEGVLELARLGVATRSGYPRERLEEVLAGLRGRDRVAFFELEPVPVSSRELRDRVARGESIDDSVPAPVARLVDELGLYRARSVSV
jgi:nicotinate-nucleotide adenylyltransferase